MHTHNVLILRSVCVCVYMRDRLVCGCYVRIIRQHLQMRGPTVCECAPECTSWTLIIIFCTHTRDVCTVSIRSHGTGQHIP